MIVQLAVFAQLAGSCAPHVAAETLAAVARTESGFHAWAIGDNTTRQSYKPTTLAEAVGIATELLVARHSIDVGLMQINNANLPRLGMTVADAFDPCKSLAAADRVLVDGYVPPGPGEDAQNALRQALSRYNTGHPTRGLDRSEGGNGYVTRVQASAEVVVPAIRLRGEAPGAIPAAPPQAAASLGGGVPVTAQPLPPPPASWDVWGQARAARGQGIVVFGPGRAAPGTVAAQPAASATPPASPPAAPVVLRALPTQQAANDVPR